MTEITFNLPTPLSVNALYRNVPGVGRVKTKEAKAWEAEAGVLLLCQIRAQHPPPEFQKVPLRVEIIVRRTSNRRKDVHNLSKGVLDLLSKIGVYADDSQVWDLRIAWGDVEACTVRISPSTLEGFKKGEAA